jgi:phytoene dehydrogenase-like protein
VTVPSSDHHAARDALAWTSHECDVVVLGAGYGGLLTAALLAQGGKRTVVVDPLEVVGQPGGALPHDGYWLAWGHRDAPGMRQVSLSTYRWNFDVAARLGIDLPLIGPHDPVMLCHLAPQGDVLAFHVADPSSLETLARDVLSVPDRHIPEFAAHLSALTATSPDDARALIPVTMGDWMETRHVPMPVRDAILAYLSVLWSVPPEDTSVGRFILNQLQAPMQLYTVNHPRFGANQGVAELYADKLRELGGEIWLDLRPLAIQVHERRVTGVLARTSRSFVRQIDAPTVVFTPPAYELFQLVDESHFSPEFVARAWRTKQFEIPLITLFMGLRDLPRRRRDGRRDDTVCWQRVLWGEERAYLGGWSIWSNSAPSTAPPGKHLIGAHLSDRMTFAEAKQKIAALLAYMREYYVDLDELVEWHEYEWVPEPSGMSWALKTGERAPMCTEVGGLYLVGYTTEVDGMDYDAEAHSALEVADMILGR